MSERPSTSEDLAYPINPSLRAEYLREQFNQHNLSDKEYYGDVIWAQTQQMDLRMKRSGVVVSDSLKSVLDSVNVNPDLAFDNDDEGRLEQSLEMLRRGYNPILLEDNVERGQSRRYFLDQLNDYDLDPRDREAVSLSLDIMNVRSALNETLEELSIVSSTDLVGHERYSGRTATSPQEKVDRYMQYLLIRTDEKKTLGYLQLTDALPALHTKRKELLNGSFGDRADEAGMLIMAFVSLRTSQRKYNDTVAGIREPFLVALEDKDLDAMREGMYEVALTNPNILTDATLNDLELGERQEWLDLIEADKLASKEPSKIDKAAELYDTSVTDVESAKQFYQDVFEGRTFLHTTKDGNLEQIRVVEFVEIAAPQVTQAASVTSYGFRTEIVNRKEGSKRPGSSRYSLRNSIIRIMTEDWVEQPVG